MNKILLIGCLLLTACKTEPESKEIKTGMMRSQVERKLGKSNTVIAWNFPYELNGKKYSKNLNAHWYSKDTVIFIDPKADTVAIVEYRYSKDRPPVYKPGK